MEPVPVAERLLETTLFGVPVRRLGQAVGLPLAPALLASLLGLEFTIVGPLLGVGLGIGAVLFYRTPAGQSPAAWLRGTLVCVLGPERSFWQPIRHQASPSMWIDRLRATGERRTVRADPPASLSEPILGTRSTLDGLDFEHVREDGIIATKTRYARILELEATPWLILDESARESTIQAFERYLAGVGSAVQFLSLPVPLDVAPHRSALAAAGGRSETESRVLQIGRQRHAAWLERVVDEGDIRDRRHFLVVSVPKDPSERTLSDRLSSSEAEAIDGIAEIEARANNARSSLPRTGVRPAILDDRSSVLEVLYRYYRGEKPPDDMDHGWLTSREEAQG